MNVNPYLIAILFSACGDNLATPPDSGLPSCASLGCTNPAASSRRCAVDLECTCSVDRGEPVSCTPPPACVGCLSLSCGTLTPDGVETPELCTCELEAGYVTCLDASFAPPR